jgi:hypothetical protein
VVDPPVGVGVASQFHNSLPRISAKSGIPRRVDRKVFNQLVGRFFEVTRKNLGIGEGSKPRVYVDERCVMELDRARLVLFLCLFLRGYPRVARLVVDKRLVVITQVLVGAYKKKILK